MAKDIGKTATFAALHFTVGFAVSYAFTGSVAIASGIALVEPLANTVVFYFHERAWSRASGHTVLGGLLRRIGECCTPLSPRGRSAAHG